MSARESRRVGFIVVMLFVIGIALNVAPSVKSRESELQETEYYADYAECEIGNIVIQFHP